MRRRRERERRIERYESLRLETLLGDQSNDFITTNTRTRKITMYDWPTKLCMFSLLHFDSVDRAKSDRHKIQTRVS